MRKTLSDKQQALLRHMYLGWKYKTYALLMMPLANTYWSLVRRGLIRIDRLTEKGREVAAYLEKRRCK